MNDFRKLVLEGNFPKAYEISKNMTKGKILDELIAISFDTKNMLAYGFAEYMLLINENGTNHSIASSLLKISYVDLDDAAELAYCHAKRALEVDPDSFDTLSNIISLSGHPDTSGTEEDFIKAKKRIAELYPNDGILKAEYKIGLRQEYLAKSKVAEWQVK